MVVLVLPIKPRFARQTPSASGGGISNSLRSAHFFFPWHCTFRSKTREGITVREQEVGGSLFLYFFRCALHPGFQGIFFVEHWLGARGQCVPVQ